MKKTMILLARDLLIFWGLLAILFIFISFCQAQTDELQFRPEKEKKVIDTAFIAVSSYLVLMTVFDVETTFSAIHRNGGREANPIMRPFVKNGRLATYGVQLAIDAVVIYAAYKIKRGESKTFGKVWWVSPMIAGTTHGVCGGLNCRYAF